MTKEIEEGKQDVQMQESVDDVQSVQDSELSTPEYKELQDGIKGALKAESEEKSKEKDNEDDGSGAGADDQGEPEKVKSGDTEQRQAPKADESLVESAIRMGLSKAEAEGIDPKALSALMKIAAKSQPKEQEAPKAEAKQDVKPAEEWKLELPEEDLSPEIVKAFKDITGRYEAKIKELSESLNGMNAHLNGERGRLAVQRFDMAIDKLGESWSKVFGKGRPEEGSEHFKNRNDLYDELNFRMMAQQKNGQNVNYEECFKKSINALFSEKALEMEREKLQSKLGERNRGMSAGRPGRSSKTLEEAKQEQQNPEAKAISAVGSLLKKIGLRT